jgi:hypothetical protein
VGDRAKVRIRFHTRKGTDMENVQMGRRMVTPESSVYKILNSLEFRLHCIHNFILGHSVFNNSEVG